MFYDLMRKFLAPIGFFLIFMELFKGLLNFLQEIFEEIKIRKEAKQQEKKEKKDE